MPPIDWTILINWIVTGFIGLVFGIIGGYATYRYDRKRDELQWEREIAKLAQQWKHEQEQMEIVWQQKLQELEIQFIREEQSRLRGELLRGIDNPSREIQIITQSIKRVKQEVRLYCEMVSSLTTLGLLDRVRSYYLTEGTQDSSEKIKHLKEILSQNPVGAVKELESHIEAELESLENLQSSMQDNPQNE